jgi:hypothetical protein
LPSLGVVGGVLMVHGALMRRSDMTSLTGRRADLTPETQHSEKEESDPVRRLAQLRSLGVGLVTVGHPNLVSLIRVPRPSAHPPNATRQRFVPPGRLRISRRTTRPSPIGSPRPLHVQSGEDIESSMAAIC